MKRNLIVALAVTCLIGAALPSLAQKVEETSFYLTPQQKFLPCFSQYGYNPTVQVIVQRGADNDTLIFRIGPSVESSRMSMLRQAARRAAAR